jgi:uncharacterized membrane protein
MWELILGLVLFLGMHSISIFAEEFRDRIAARSEIGWKGFYGLVSLVGLVLIARGYGSARLDPVVLYGPPVFLKHLAVLALLPVFVLFLAPYFPGRIQAAVKHPQLVSVKLWAVAHLLANGTLADLLLFGSFLGWAVADRISMKRRRQRVIPTAPRTGFNDILLLAAGLGLYLAFLLWLHGMLFGVAPLG